MKFVLRDDDINYHYQPTQLDKWYEGIIDICPVSVCIPAFFKGEFNKGLYRTEHHIKRSWEERISDKIYRIGDNQELVDYLRGLLSERKISISLHGITHRNEEEISKTPIKGNYIGGAEFYTQNDYTESLRQAKEYLDSLFNIYINSFTPPQNMVSYKGLQALVNNNLSLCADLVYTRDLKELIHFYVLKNVFLLAFYRKFIHFRYPFIIKHKVKFIDHTRLQPGSNIQLIKQTFDFARSRNGVFVLSTHSYGFYYKMEQYDMTMKEALVDILKYTKQFNDVEYTTLHELFK